MKHRGEVSLPTAFPTAVENNVSIPSVVDIAEEVKRRILPDLLQAACQTRANDLACLLNSLGINVASPPSQALTQPVTHMMHPSRLRDLRTFLQDDSAVFKDPQQSSALELIRGKEPSLLVIGPTGTNVILLSFFLHFLTFNSRIRKDPSNFYEYWPVRQRYYNSYDPSTCSDARRVQIQSKAVQVGLWNMDGRL